VSFEVGTLSQSMELLTAAPARDEIVSANWGNDFLQDEAI
jgi:hypothetical protein